MSRIKGTITPSEYEVLEVMWNAEKELTASEIVKISQNKTWKSSSDRKSTRLNSSHVSESRMPSSA